MGWKSQNQGRAKAEVCEFTSPFLHKPSVIFGSSVKAGIGTVAFW